MRKIKTLLKAPLLTQSGYGVHSRQIFNALFSDPLFDLHVESLRWGQCSFLVGDSEEKQKIRKCQEKFIIEKHEGNSKYDLFIHVTIPNEFEKLGSVNIGVTAGVETDRISHVWVQKCNEMDLIIVPSEFTKKVIETTIIEWENSKTNEKGTFKVDKPVIVCSEGTDTGVFRKYAKEELVQFESLYSKINLAPDFCFLHVGQWGNGGFGEDRKNIANLVKYFIESFQGRQDVGLVLKVNLAKNTVADKNMVLGRLSEIKSNYKLEDVPPIYLVHGSLSDTEMAGLYNHPKIKAFVSLTHGEGFGLPLLEAAACDLPVLATNWSGHLDFLNKGKFIGIEYDLREVAAPAIWEPVIIKGSGWAEVKPEDVKRRLTKIVKASSMPNEWAKDLGQKIREDFDVQVTNQNFVDTLKQLLLKENQSAPKTVSPKEHLESFLDTPDSYNVLFTMPRSNGDVFVSTAVIDGLKKELPQDGKIYFATQPKYFPILAGNPNIHKLIPWNETMLNMDLTESVFDLALTPDIATQYTFSNWIRRGQGRLLAEEYAAHCRCELGDYFIKKDDSILEVVLNQLKTIQGERNGYAYMTFHPGSGAGQWESRRYDDWQEILNNLKAYYPDLAVVQVGAADEPTFDGVDVDLRGKTSVHQLASVVENSQLNLSIDTFSMHLAAALKVPLVALFGCSYATSTGPWVKDKEHAKFILMQSERLSGCRDKACYKDKCAVNPSNPPINEIDPMEVTQQCMKLLDSEADGKLRRWKEHSYTRIYGKISGYTTAYNLAGYPFVESIKSMLGFCEEVVVVDGCSTDGTYEVLQKLAEEDKRVQLYQNQWDFEEPGMDGMQKAYARALCQYEFLWQQDCDEVVHEIDYDKILMITKRFPKNADILHLPVVELWGNGESVTGRRHSWKWRMSRNKPEITHGINKHARITDERTGKVYAKNGMSDGCEYVNAMTYEMIPHTGFYSAEIEHARLQSPEEYATIMNRVFAHVPSVFHYSWCSLENKIKNFTSKWDKQWNILYQTQSVARFPGIETEEQIKTLAQHLYDQGGEDSDSVKYKFKIEKPNPGLMKDWLSKVPLNG